MTEAHRTPLHDLHLALGAKMVTFAGYSLPVRYPTGIIEEHRHTREAAGLFDVSHMGQLRLRGAEAAACLETLVPVDVVGLEPFRQRYAVLTNETGGILDDFMITNLGDHLMLVVNASRKTEDIAHLREHFVGRLDNACEIEVRSSHALLALQGPKAVAVLSRMEPATAELGFMSAARLPLLGCRCVVSRSGYTGEDGFEISVPAENAQSLAQALLAHEEVRPVGLGARDSLRLEAGLCLYGHELDESTSPVEADLRWMLSKARRADGARPGGYPGYERIRDELANGVRRKRVGLTPEGRAPVRDGAELEDEAGRRIGVVTSGGFGPSVDGPIAMGYVETAYADPGTRVAAVVRGRRLPVRVSALPFVTRRYRRK